MSVPELEARIESCQGLVRSIAIAIHKKLHGVHDLDDLIAYGQLGSAQAAREFDPARGAQFSTYAYYRIRGAIYDGVAKMGWQKMTVRRDAAWNEVLAEDAEKKEEAATSDSGDWLEGITERMATASLLSSSGDSSKMDVADADAVQPITEICSAELKVHLHRLVDQLPPDTAQLIRDTYFQGLTMQEAAANLGVSKSWASRMHAKGLQILGERLRLMGLDE